MATQDELAALFSRNLSLQQPVSNSPSVQVSAPTEEPYNYSISQHYTHSAHVVARPASEPPQTEQLTMEIILGRHGVEVNSLSPSQINLFRTADTSQQMRLVELWRICPPDSGENALAQNLGAWSATSLGQEETLAKLRYERQMMEERLSRASGDQHGIDSDTMSDASTNQPMTPIQGGDGRWAGNGITAEPYMSSGYESLAQQEYERSAAPLKETYSHFGTAVGGPAYHQATDPVYNCVSNNHNYPNSGGDWQKLLEQRQQVMENQYGAFEQQFHHNNGGVTAAVYQEDEEML